MAEFTWAYGGVYTHFLIAILNNEKSFLLFFCFCFEIFLLLLLTLPHKLSCVGQTKVNLNKKKVEKILLILATIDMSKFILFTLCTFQTGALSVGLGFADGCG